jgi:hypothetical protein
MPYKEIAGHLLDKSAGWSRRSGTKSGYQCIAWPVIWRRVAILAERRESIGNTPGLGEDGNGNLDDMVVLCYFCVDLSASSVGRKRFVDGFLTQQGATAH